MSRSTRALKNTIYMYIRSGIQIVVSLYAVRILLVNLGIYDYGIYNVVGNIVVLSSFVTAALSSSTQRYISYALGEGDNAKLARTVHMAKKLHIILSAVVFVLCEIVGIVFIHNYMSIEATRQTEVIAVLQFSILSFLVNINIVPYRSLLIAHERFDVLSIATIIDSFNRLGIAWVIGFFFVYSRIITYSALFVLITFGYFLFIYYYYRRYHIPYSFDKNSDKVLAKGMLSFSSWNLLGGMGQILVNQLTNMFVNVFCGPVVNAAQGVANQVNAAIYRFSSDFMSAVSPQITKSYSSKDYGYLGKIVFSSTKMSYFLMYSVAIPLIFNVDYILSLWLQNVPDYAPSFVKFLMINSCILTLYGASTSLIESGGRIKYPQIGYVITMAVTTLFSFIVLKGGGSPNIVYYMLIASSVGSLVVTIYYVNKYQLASIKDYMCVLTMYILPFSLLYFLSYSLILAVAFPEIVGIGRLIISFFLSAVFLPVYGYFLYLSNLEKQMIRSIINKKRK